MRKNGNQPKRVFRFGPRENPITPSNVFTYEERPSSFGAVAGADRRIPDDYERAGRLGLRPLRHHVVAVRREGTIKAVPPGNRLLGVEYVA